MDTERVQRILETQKQEAHEVIRKFTAEVAQKPAQTLRGADSAYKAAAMMEVCDELLRPSEESVRDRVMGLVLGYDSHSTSRCWNLIEQGRREAAITLHHLLPSE